MLSTYIIERVRDFLCETLPCPAIMPVKIGTIGRTQGVNASKSPAKKKIIELYRIEFDIRESLIAF
tara:strand:+ start:3163 stop:3360 length:198 start_codon:yes stop_codon:yes gene_type:complete